MCNIFPEVTPTRRQQLVITFVKRTAEVRSASYNTYIATLLGVDAFVASCVLYYAGAITTTPGIYTAVHVGANGKF